MTGTDAGKDRNVYLFKIKVIFMKKILFLFEYLGYAGDDIYKLPLISHFRGGPVTVFTLLCWFTIVNL